jgi:acyl-CoA synthetase (AMP-forming)/AMP-acid ligase II/acetyltransferase-like isoleucine patch superfamily enzyme/acyl carrier protein
MERRTREHSGQHNSPSFFSRFLLDGGRKNGGVSPSLHNLANTLSTSHTPSHMPLEYLKSYLTGKRSNNSIYDLIRFHTECWKRLPEDAKSGLGSEHDGLVETTSRLVKSSYTSILDLLPVNIDSPAIIDGNSDRSLSQRDLSKFVRTFHLSGARTEVGKAIVAVALPNGALLALLSVAVAARYKLAPINATSGAEQFRMDLLSTGAKNVMVLPSDIHRLGLDKDWIQIHGIEVFIVSPADDMTCTIATLSQSPPSTSIYTTPNGPDDTCLILLTSGTTGTRKVVPVTLHSIISAVSFIGESWKLTERDVCLNMMPLNHVGGLVRNLFAPILLGGSTICCGAFDPNLFWDLVAERGPTWYYASPTMHSAILDEAPSQEMSITRSRIRMVCNAAGCLLPSLALRLRDSFHCPILPSYGMTECMPISTPPLEYELDRPGTCGISIGPELAILDATDQKESVGNVGRICVRGNPVFAGYVVDGKTDRTAFTRDGWFNTGDLGYMDNDGYLYITGRSKEVINRGGEIISPFEIEEAIMTVAREEGSPIHGRISDTLAFSVPHETLEESVGIVLVTPPNKPRVDLRQLHEAMKLSLHSTKWPITVVYMDAVPKRNGKLARVGLAERMDFVSLGEDMSSIERHFEASSLHADGNGKIEKYPCRIDQEFVVDAFDTWLLGEVDVLARINATSGFLDAILAPRVPETPINNLNIAQLKMELGRTLHGYLIPEKVTVLDVPFPRDTFGSIDSIGVDTILASKKSSRSSQTVESKIQDIYAELLRIPAEDISSKSDFFELGGDSLKAGRLLSIIRKEFNARIPIDKLFTSSRVCDMCEIINEYQSVTKKAILEENTIPSPHFTKTCSSTRISILLMQLLPLAVFTPLTNALFWMVFLKTWSMALQNWPRLDAGGNFICLLTGLFVARTALGIALPLTAIVAKWVIIGKYKEGLYPMWSLYHSRWWLVQKIIQVCGIGAFRHFNWSRVLFYRLLGAKIGNGVLIEPGTIFGEYDLLDIGDNVQLDRCICRPFAVDHNTTMYLAKIRMGKNSAAGLKTVIAPGTDLPEDTCLGINSSSWEWQEAGTSDYSQLATQIPQPHWLLFVLVSLPILLVVSLATLLPWIGALSMLRVSHVPTRGADTMLHLVSWLASPTRIGLHFLIRILNTLCVPVIRLSLVVLIKRVMDSMFGKIQPGLACQRSHVDRFRMDLLSRLIPDGNIKEITSFFGAHYEITSMVVRSLGGKVGKRVYWPGSGPSIQNFDLIDIGDDVVFGSYAHLITSDGIGCDYVRVSEGAMVADRVAILPGCQVGKQALMGSGTLTRRNTNYPDDSTWVGSKAGGPICLSTVNSNQLSSTYSNHTQSTQHLNAPSEEASLQGQVKNISYNTFAERQPAFPGSLHPSIITTALPSNESSPLLSPTSTIPFGRAFYEKDAPYHVYGLFSITMYSVFINLFVSVYWNTPAVLTLIILANTAKNSFATSLFDPSPYQPLLVLGILFASFSVLQVVFSVLAMAICIRAKWFLFGQREKGDYDWDKSSYCQRWQIFLTIERIRRTRIGGEDILGLLTGTAYVSQYYRLQGSKIGENCALFAGGEMSVPFTEPDLLTIGDQVAVDDASLVAHINSRGNFKLNPLFIGDRCVLRTGSRVLSGATMEDDSCLLEHTLVMGGDETEAGTTCQGWPADDFTKERVSNKLVNTDDGTEDEILRKGWSWFGIRGWFQKGGGSGGYQRFNSTS